MLVYDGTMIQPVVISEPTRKRWSDQDRFIEAFRICGNVTKSCEISNVSRGVIYGGEGWVSQDETNAGRELFSERFEKARNESIEYIEAELYRRAVEGIEKPVYQGGKLVGHIQEYSDQLMMFLLRGLNPAKWREKFEGANLIGVGGNLNVQNNQIVAQIANMTEDELKRLAERGRKSE